MSWHEHHGKTRDLGLISFAHHAEHRPGINDVTVLVKEPAHPPFRAVVIRVGNEGVTVRVSSVLGPVRAGTRVVLRWMLAGGA